MDVEYPNHTWNGMECIYEFTFYKKVYYRRLMELLKKMVLVWCYCYLLNHLKEKYQRQQVQKHHNVLLLMNHVNNTSSNHFVTSIEKKDGILLNHSNKLIVVLSLVTIWFFDKTHRDSKIDKEEHDWLKLEIEKRKERLEQVIEYEKENIAGENQVVDVDCVLEATSEVSKSIPSDPLVQAGLVVAAQGVAKNIQQNLNLEKNVQDEEISGSRAEDLNRQLALEKSIYEEGRDSIANIQKLKKIMYPQTSKARKVLKIRWTSQLSKTTKLMERAKSQLPYMCLSALLSMFCGAIVSLKTNCMGEITDIAYKTVMNDNNNNNNIKARITIIAKYLLKLEILDQLCSFVARKLKDMGSKEFILQMKTDLFRSLLSQDLVYFEQHDLYQLRQVIGDCDYVCNSLFELPIDSIRQISTILSSVYFMVSKNVQLALLVGFLQPLRLALTHVLKSTREKLEKYMGENSPSATGTIRDIWMVLVNPVALRTMRSFAREPLETKLFTQALKSHNRSLDRGVMFYNMFDITQTIMEKSMEILSLYVGGKLAAAGKIDASYITTFETTSQFAFNQAQMLYYTFNGLFLDGGMFDSYERMYDLLNSKPQIGIDYPPISEMPKSMNWDISLDKVSFSYPTRPQASVLDNITLEFKQGNRVGILGESGCGKSTIISLLLRLYDTSNGEILVGDRSIKSLNPLWLRRNIAVVSQSIYLPYNTVKENLMYGFVNETNKMDENQKILEMKNALRLAKCYDLFFDKTRFPQEWHTDIGRDGAKLSGGERQRLCIARAILTKPKILILDEATSALDEESQFKVQESIQQLYEESNRSLTIISIAHRLSNFRYVDKLFVLDKGKLVEQGTPKELLHNKSGIFSNYVDRSTLDFDK